MKYILAAILAAIIIVVGYYVIYKVSYDVGCNVTGTTGIIAFIVGCLIVGFFL